MLFGHSQEGGTFHGIFRRTNQNFWGLRGAHGAEQRSVPSWSSAAAVKNNSTLFDYHGLATIIKNQFVKNTIKYNLNVI